MSMKMEVSQITFSYDSWPILEGITYRLPQSSFTGLIGPNGSGKSTLLKTMTRFLIPEKGHLYLDGQEIGSYNSRDLARKMAVVPQNTAMAFDFQVRDMILMGRTPHQGPFQGESQRDREIVEEAMRDTNTQDLAKRSFLDLSGGEKQRVIIARALSQKPEILLLDEPTSHLDINYQLEIFELLRRLNLKKEMTIIVVSHDLNLASQYCSELILLKEGRIFSLGPPEKVITKRNLEEVYNTRVVIRENPSGRPHVFLQSLKDLTRDNESRSIHVICGGGSGGVILENLATLGFTVSTGVLNKGDMDWKTATYLGLTLIEEEAFAPISKDCYEANLALMEKAHTIILAKVPFGHGNLLNLRALEKIGKKGKEIFLMETSPGEKRDYTRGEAERILNRLQERYSSISDFKELLGRLSGQERGERWTKDD